MIDRASDAWGVPRWPGERAARVIVSIATALTYGIAYLALRQASNDQWYLPAGLRFAALLTAPYRLWPALFLGEVAALATFRMDMIPTFGWAYYIGSCVAAWPVVAVVVRQLRRITQLPVIARATDALALVIAGLLSAELVGMVNKATAAYLKLGSAPFKVGDLIVYSIGHVQGILLASFALVVGVSVRRDAAAHRALLVEAACAAVMCVLLATAVTATGATNEAALMAARLCLLVPAVALTFRYGWRGAAVGTVLANLALFWTIPHQEAGQVDGTGMLMQEAFAFVSFALFVLGSRAPIRVAVPAAAPVIETDARTLARAHFESTERQRRETALRVETMQQQSRGSIEPMVAMLRKRGQSEIAMNLIGIAHTQSTQFSRDFIDSIYPLTLERSGLFAAVESDAFQEHFAGTPYTVDLTGSPHSLPVATQLAAYRVLGEAIEHLNGSAPASLRIRLHCSIKAGRGVISMALTAVAPTVRGRSSYGTARLAQLRNHVAAYGGALCNRGTRMRLHVVEDMAVVEVARVAAAVATPVPALVG